MCACACACVCACVHSNHGLKDVMSLMTHDRRSSDSRLSAIEVHTACVA